MTTEPSRNESMKEQRLAAERFGKKDIKGFVPRRSKQTNTGAHAKKAASPSSRILPLDGLRALAIIGVVFYHTRPSLLSGGFLGVTLFFVLAGYFATRSSRIPARLITGAIWQNVCAGLCRPCLRQSRSRPLRSTLQAPVCCPSCRPMRCPRRCL